MKQTKTKTNFDYFRLIAIAGIICFACGFVSQMYFLLNNISLNDASWFFFVGFPIIFGGVLIGIDWLININNKK